MTIELTDGLSIGRRTGVRLAGGGASAPTLPVPVLGSELIVNGGFDADTNWTKTGAWAISGGQATSNGASGYLTQSVLTSNRWYQAQVDLVARAAGNMRPGFGGASGLLNINNTAAGTTVVQTYYANGTVAAIGAIDGTNNLSVDNASFREITRSSLFGVPVSYGTHQVTTANATIVRGTQAGVVANLDSASNPANYVIAMHDGATARLLKAVGGTITVLVAVAATYAAGATIEIRRLAASNTYQLWYNGTQRGTDQTISDAGIVSNTLHGYFNTYASNTLAAFSCTASV